MVAEVVGVRRTVVSVRQERLGQGAVCMGGGGELAVEVRSAPGGLPESVVFVIDGAASVRETVVAAGLRACSFPSREAFLEAYEPELPGCVLVEDGFDLLARLGGREAPLPIVLTTSRADFHMAVRAFRAGAVDVLEKPLDPQVIVDRVQPLVEQDRARRIARAGRAAVLARLASLTVRERMVLDGLLEGRTSKEIAGGLDISTRTVETHRAHVLDKLEAGSTGHAVRMVLLATRTIGRSTP